MEAAVATTIAVVVFLAAATVQIMSRGVTAGLVPTTVTGPGGAQVLRSEPELELAIAAREIRRQAVQAVEVVIPPPEDAAAVEDQETQELVFRVLDLAALGVDQSPTLADLGDLAALDEQRYALFQDAGVAPPDLNGDSLQNADDWARVHDLFYDPGAAGLVVPDPGGDGVDRQDLELLRRAVPFRRLGVQVRNAVVSGAPEDVWPAEPDRIVAGGVVVFAVIRDPKPRAQVANNVVRIRIVTAEESGAFHPSELDLFLPGVPAGPPDP